MVNHNTSFTHYQYFKSLYITGTVYNKLLHYSTIIIKKKKAEHRKTSGSGLADLPKQKSMVVTILWQVTPIASPGTVVPKVQQGFFFLFMS